MANKPTLVTINVLADNGMSDLEHIAKEMDILGLKYVWQEREKKSKSELRRITVQLTGTKMGRSVDGNV